MKATRSIPLLLLALGLATTLRASGPQFWRVEGTRAFLEGELDGASVDSEGRLRLGPAPRPLFDPEAPNAWCVARDARGVLYVGTGNEGRVIRIDGALGSVLFDAEELGVHAIAVGPDGRVYAATSPDGAVWAIDAAGNKLRFFDPAEKYIWALAFDAKGSLVVATGGEGRVYRVQPDGSAQVLLASSETHILSLAVARDGRVYAGSAPEGLVYRLSASSRPFVVVDTPFREIKALGLGGDGTLYAAAIDGRAPETTPRPAQAPAPGGRFRPGHGRGHGERELHPGCGPRRGRLARGTAARGAAQGRVAADPGVGRRRDAVELARRRAVRRRADRGGSAGRDGQPRQAVSGRRRSPLRAPGNAAGGAGDGHRRDDGRRCRARDGEPGPRARPRRHALDAWQLRVARQGRRVPRELGPAHVGRRRSRRHVGAPGDAGRQHRHAGCHLDGVDAAFGRRSRDLGEGALSAGAGRAQRCLGTRRRRSKR